MRFSLDYGRVHRKSRNFIIHALPENTASNIQEILYAYQEEPK